MTKIAVLARHPVNEEIEPIETTYSGPIPPKVWKRLNARFLKLNAGNYFYPLDAMDAYQSAIAEVAAKADRIASGELVLVRATPETYLTSAANLALLNFHLRKVQSARNIHRRIEQTTCGTGAVGEDGFDIDNHNGAEDAPDSIMCTISGEPYEASVPTGAAMTAQQLAEALPGVPSYRERRELAQRMLGDICEAALRKSRPLGEEMTLVFAAYIVSEGNHHAAAGLIQCKRSTWFNRWKRTLSAAKTLALAKPTCVNIQR